MKEIFEWFRRLAGIHGSSSGAEAEDAAAAWLRRHRDFSIIARNWRNPRDRREELDLVGRERDVLVFVEVKARSAGALVPGYYAIDRRKKQVLRRAVRAYLRGLTDRPHTIRFDVIEVILGSESRPPEILHFENVPLLLDRYRG